MENMVGISPKNLDVLLKYLEGLHIRLCNKFMFFKLKIIEEECVQEQYIETIGNKKWKPSGSK